MELTIDQLEHQLRTLPELQPDPAWRQRTKHKLMAVMALRGKLPEANCWAIFATYESDPIDFAAWVRAKGRAWRPLAVNPERLGAAVSSLQPNLVVIDSNVPRRAALAQLVRAASMADMHIAAQHELALIA